MHTTLTARRAIIGVIFVVAFLVLASIPRAQAASFWYVATTGNDANICTSPATPCATINGAIDKASSGDTIYVATGVYTGTGSNPILKMWVNPVNLSGGWNSTFSQQVGFSILDGEKQRVVAGIHPIGYTVNVNVDHFVLQNGLWGLVTSGSYVVITNCVVRDNTPGGGILVQSSYLAGFGISMVNCSLTGNQHIGGVGGAIETYDNVFFSNVTISDNYADAGGALAVKGRAWINNSTIAGNTTGVHDGGGIVNRGTITMKNSILANNVAHFYDDPTNDDCVTEGGSWKSDGYNLVGTLGNCGFTPAASDLVDTDPQLGVLQGLLAYRPLLPGSPALNAGTPTGCTDHYGSPLPYDIRGMPRAGRCDIGSYEVGLAVTKSASDILPNKTATYTIQLDNQEGLSLLNGLVLTDTLPGSTTYIPNSLIFTNGSGGVSGSTITWTGSVSGNIPTMVSLGVQVSPPLIATNVVTVGWANATFTAGATLGAHRSFLPLTSQGKVVPTYTCPTSYFDDFSNPASGWPTTDDSYALAEYFNSEYRILTRQAGYFYWARAPLACDLQNYVVEVDARWDGIPGSSYGLVLNLSSDGQYFQLFDINTDLQQYRVLAHSPIGWTEMAPLTTTAAILPGNATNHLKVLVNSTGGYMTLMVNGTVLIDRRPPSIANGSVLADGQPGSIANGGSWKVGLSSVSYPDQPTSDARFDNFHLIVLPPFDSNTQGTQTISSSQETGRTSLPILDLSWKERSR